MSEDGEAPLAAQQHRRWFSWVWIVPLIAVGVVLWLTVRALVDRGPLITISFTDAEGLQAMRVFRRCWFQRCSASRGPAPHGLIVTYPPPTLPALRG